MSKVIGLGNALVDLLIQIDSDDFLAQHNLPKGSMQLYDQDFINNMLDGTSGFPRSISSGGSAANTIHGLANLGVDTGFMGKIGHDDLGNFFKEDLVNHKIEPTLFYGQADSGKAVALISPDSERTFTTFLGASLELGAEDLDESHFKGYDYFHIEGYLVQNHDLISRAVELAKECDCKVSLDLASFNVVDENLDFLRDLVKNYVDILFANEEEAKSFTGKEPLKALDEIAEITEIAVVKVGKKGSYVKSNNKIHEIGIIPVKSIDTTGAGDLYAAGFLYGLTEKYSLDTCGAIGSILSGKVIEIIGAKMDNARWDIVREMVRKVI
jgi:sugar/nucleoside kinase (ribokinase family)